MKSERIPGINAEVFSKPGQPNEELRGPSVNLRGEILRTASRGIVSPAISDATMHASRDRTPLMRSEPGSTIRSDTNEGYNGVYRGVEDGNDAEHRFTIGLLTGSVDPSDAFAHRFYADQLAVEARSEQEQKKPSSDEWRPNPQDEVNATHN
jgi:hypothetical protein